MCIDLGSYEHSVYVKNDGDWGRILTTIGIVETNIPVLVSTDDDAFNPTARPRSSTDHALVHR